jgi:hypothetical protein
MRMNSFEEDLIFLKNHLEVIELGAPDNDHAHIVVIPAYQGRVMTSTSSGSKGNSYGWINYELIQSGQLIPHMNAFGGEERLWLTPEGGQFSVYFKKADPFEYECWQTPAVIDSLPFEVTYQDACQVQLRAEAKLENHLGTAFEIEIKREVQILSTTQIFEKLGIDPEMKCQAVGYETRNQLINQGADWQREKGVLGIWLLGMFIPSDQTNILVPVQLHETAELALTDDYFGKVPADRLKVSNEFVTLVADGKHRSKIGIAAGSAKNVAGSYDEAHGVLTIIQFDVDPVGDYLKSTWELHEDPFGGDVLNAYNDGPLADGSQMGPFYELESNSSTKVLKRGEALKHVQCTFHFEGEKSVISEICKKVLGINL